MPSHTHNTPALRFPGYIGVWEQQKLDDLYIFAGSGGTPKSTNQQYYNGSIPFLGISDITGRDITQTKKTITEEGLHHSTAWIVPAGAISLAMYASVGEIGILTHDTATSQAFYNMVFDDDRVRDFIYYRLFKAAEQAEYEPLISTGTQRNLNAEKIKNFTVQVTSVDEMGAIGHFFRKLDDLIGLHQRQTQKLTELKQGLLHEMFPREGESVPQLRFPGFTDTWKQQNVGDIATIVGGGTPATTHSEYWNGTIDWYAPAEITNQRYVSHSQRQITQLGLEKSSAQLLPAHKTVLFTSRAGIGKMAILQREAATNQGFQSLVLHDDIDPYFIYSMNAILKKKAEKIAAGSTFLEISGSHLAHIRITIPSLSEQKQIGSFFRTLDDRIHCHEQYTVKLVELKKGLLQKMFPQD